MASTVWMSISIHLQWHPTNGEGIQFASIHSKTILFYGFADIYHQAKPMWWNPQTACRLTVNVPPLLQEQINPRLLWWECRQLTINMYVFRQLYCVVTIFRYVVQKKMFFLQDMPGCSDDNNPLCSQDVSKP